MAMIAPTISASSIENHHFGHLTVGEPVTGCYLAEFEGANRLQVSISSGAMDDVALGFDLLKPYLKSRSYLRYYIGPEHPRVEQKTLAIRKIKTTKSS